MYSLKDTYFYDSSDCFSINQAFPVDMVNVISLCSKMEFDPFAFCVAFNVLFLFVEGD